MGEPSGGHHLGLVATPSAQLRRQEPELWVVAVGSVQDVSLDNPMSVELCARDSSHLTWLVVSSASYQACGWSSLWKWNLGTATGWARLGSGCA